MCNFLFAVAMQFQQIIVLPSHNKTSICSMSYTGNATHSEKLQKSQKLRIFWQIAILQVAVFLRDDNAIFSENFIAVASEKFVRIAAA